MSEWKTRTAAHLRAAQGWLSKAERSFDEKKDIRGAQEEKRSPKTRFRYACCRQGGALICAVLLFGIGSLIWMGRGADEIRPSTPSPVRTTAAQHAEPIVSRTSIANEPSLPHTSTARYEEYNEAHRTPPAVSLSREEMQDLMRAAGRSLRGQ